MSRLRLRSRFLFLVVPLALPFAGLARAQGGKLGDSDRPAVEERLPFVFEGVVSNPDGSPAEGVVVVSSAGGRAITNAGGGYRLEADVPVDAECVQVTAVGGAASGVASTSVQVRSLAGQAAVQSLRLAHGVTCDPSWLPTFGGRPGTSHHIHALLVYDDGDGPALYAGGEFSLAGGVSARDRKSVV